MYNKRNDLQILPNLYYYWPVIFIAKSLFIIIQISGKSLLGIMQPECYFCCAGDNYSVIFEEL